MTGRSYLRLIKNGPMANTSIFVRREQRRAAHLRSDVRDKIKCGANACACFSPLPMHGARAHDGPATSVAYRAAAVLWEHVHRG